MDEAALDRVQLRISAGPKEDRQSARFEVALERSREQIEALEAATVALQTAIPTQVGEAVRDGLRTETLPVARHIAELRGLFNQANRRLARIEADVLAERKARVDDLALLVDLVSVGWRGVDARLERLEAADDSVVSNDRAEKAAHEELPAPREQAGGEQAGREQAGRQQTPHEQLGREQAGFDQAGEIAERAVA